MKVAFDLVAASQLALAAALFFATAALAWFTRAMARAMWSQLDWSLRPVVAPTLEFIGPVHSTFRFQNVGNGVANDVRIKISSEPATLELEWAYPSLLPRQSAAILMPTEFENSQGFEKLHRVHFDVTCLDVWGQPRPQHHVLELAPFHERLAKTPTRYEETEKELLETQTEELKRIATELPRITEAMRRK